MADMALSQATISELSALIRRREVSARDIMESCLAQIEQKNSRLNAFVLVDQDGALAAAAAADEALAHGTWYGPLHGIPLAVKDNYWTAGLATTACSQVLADNVTAVDATAVARLRSAGAIIVGKTNMHEWAYGGTNEVSAFGPARNPWNPDHIPGGSSGGSGAALAARLVPAALGSDTGGSVRIPASACGVSGLKPTYGRVSRHGVLPLSWSLDVAGPMARSARDLALLFSAMAGPDPLDETTLEEPITPFSPASATTLRGLRVAVPHGPGFETASDVARCVEAALNSLRDDGAELIDATLPGIEHAFAAWNAIMFAEATAFHQPYLANSHAAYSSSVRVQLEAGRLISATDYLKAQQYRVALNREVAAILAKADVIGLPTLPVTATRIGQERVAIEAREVTPQDAMTYVTWLANMSGLPAVSVPCGFGDDGLPVGLTFMGPALSDNWLLTLADRFQALTDWHERTPQP
ncbi:MAG: amidase [Alphaproteobacteria bacterium]|nr:amidase [Alphaproteobacteria bacterium]